MTYKEMKKDMCLGWAIWYLKRYQYETWANEFDKNYYLMQTITHLNEYSDLEGR